MKRPVWLLSLDTEQFRSAPLTTGGLKAYFQVHGRSAATTDVEIVHFAAEQEVRAWLDADWAELHLHRARQAALCGLEPVVGLSVYTWNAAVFFEVALRLKESCPELTIVAGGPHVQRAQDILGSEAIDVVVLGEGELTLQEWLDAEGREQWAEVAGLEYLEPEGAITRTAPRARTTELDSLPSPLDAIDLEGPDGRPLYKVVAYETSRGCPFACSFCEWGTGAIGTKMHQHGLERVQSDFDRIIAAGVEDIWLCDSNFGALREDLDKARMVVELKRRTGRPYSFQTSWSKNHNARVQEIVVMLAEHGLLHHYNLALQTLTPLALTLSNRKNMRVNRYAPIAKSMAERGVTIATELIWGLPGDNLADFEANLDRLIVIFPNINIFGYTLLPGTEFFERREEYRIETVPVAGYGKAKGEYVVACHTFSREEGLEGYFLITAHIMLIRGHVMPLTARLLALSGGVRVSALLRAALHALARALAPDVPGLDAEDRLAVYEGRAPLYLALVAHLERAFAVLRDAVDEELIAQGVGVQLRERAARTLELDYAFCPRTGSDHVLTQPFGFAAETVALRLGRMELPPAEAFGPAAEQLEIAHPAHVGEVLQDPDGGSWMQGRLRSASRDAQAAVASRDAGP